MMASACLHPITFWSGVCDACGVTSGLIRAASEQGLVEALVPLGWAFPGWGFVLCPSCALVEDNAQVLTGLYNLVDGLMGKTRAAVRAATEAPE